MKEDRLLWGKEQVVQLADEENKKHGDSWPCSGNSILRWDVGLLKLSKLISKAELGMG